MSFLIASGLLLLFVVVVLAWAVLRTPHRAGGGDLAGRMAAELNDDVAAGVLAPEDLPAATSDIEVQRAQEASSRNRGRLLPWSVVVLVAVTGVVVYWQTGNWRAAIYGDRAAVMHRA